MSGTLIASVHLQSGDAPHRQAIRAGHHDLVADEPATNGGADAGPSPFSLLLSALVACTSITLRMYADRKGWALGGIRIEARMVRGGPDRGGAFQIERLIRLGAALSDEQKQRLGEIAEKTPVTRAILAGTPISTSFA